MLLASLTGWVWRGGGVSHTIRNCANRCRKAVSCLATICYLRDARSGVWLNSDLLILINLFSLCVSLLLYLVFVL